jgi:hypothetical protein
VTTAPMDNRGGMRPNAPQNNPANVSGTGGAGQSGDYTGFAYGMNQQVNQQRVAGNAAVASTTASAPAPMQLPDVTPITADTQMPDQTIFDGAPIGDGMNSIPGLPTNQNDNVNFNAAMTAYYPVLNYIASRPDTSAETRDVLNTLMRGV